MLRRRLVKTVLATLTAAALVCAAQTQPDDWALAPLVHGRLVLWVVHPASTNWVARANDDLPQSPIQLPKTVQEQTAGSFGQTSSTYGQTSSTYGTAPSEVGTSLAGISQVQPASAGPGSFGQPASNVGQTAGSYGQTSSSYGESLSTIANAANPHPAPRLAQRSASQWDEVAISLRQSFPGLELVVYDVKEEDLAFEMRHMIGSSDSPDVLVGSPLPWRWTEYPGSTRRELTLASLGPGFLPVQMEAADPREWEPYRYDGRLRKTQAAIVGVSQNRRAAEAFLVWLADASVCGHCALKPEAQEPAAIAREAVKGVLEGGGIDPADADLAPGSAEWMQAIALAGRGSVDLDDVKVSTDVVDAMAGKRLAVVDVRAIVHTARGFGVTHALVVERRDASGAWRVLQLSPALSGAMARQGMEWIGSLCSGEPTDVEGVKQASPPDGDNRSAQPDLLWDPGHGAALQIVEWQQKYGDTYTGSRLFYVPDRDPHVRTRVTAEFATASGVYRWRVWSLGSGGSLVLSPWRSMLIV